MERSPQYFEFFGRTVQVNDQQGPRWYDLGLTRQESAQAEKKFPIFIAQSLDANQVTVIDDVKVYGKNKGEFSWPEELDSVVTNAAVAAPNSLPAINGYLHSFRQTMDEKDLATLSLPDRLLAYSMQVLTGAFALQEDREKIGKEIFPLTSQMLQLVPPIVHKLIRQRDDYYSLLNSKRYRTDIHQRL